MSHDRSIFIAHVSDRALRARVEARARLLDRYFAPLGPAVTRSWWDPETSTLRGTVDWRAERCEPDLLRWGPTPPVSLGSAAAVLGAAPRALEALDESTILVAAESGRVRVVSGTGAPYGLERSSADGICVWASHAAVASWLARGAVELDPDTLPEVLALGAPLGRSSHLRGTTNAGPGTIVDITTEGPHEHQFASRADRWAPPDAPPGEALEAALLDTLDASCERARSPWLALTAGRDSAVIAAGLKRLSRPLPTFTWGHPDWPDVAGAAKVAATLGFRHEAVELVARDPAEAWTASFADVVRTDGLSGLSGFAVPALPEDLTDVLLGAGGEVARSYYYSWAARSHRRPSSALLASLLGPRHRLNGAAPGAADRVDQALIDWLASARRYTRDPWATLDIYYIEQRMGRWGRSRPATRGYAFLAPFTAPQVARAAIALPLEDRIQMRFHRSFVGAVSDAIELPAQASQRRGIPRSLRRAASRRRAGNAPPQASFLAADLDHRPEFCAKVEAVLERDDVRDLIGPEWTASLLCGFRQRELYATDATLLLGGLVALADIGTRLCQDIQLAR